ncbi:hypothetical protein Emag_006743 [Eimeria magna]
MRVLRDSSNMTFLALVSAGLYALSAADAVHHSRHGHSPRPHASSFAAVKETSLAADNANNPFLEEPYASFMARFNIPKVHGAGIYVDLANEKEVDGKLYREAGGRCPVFGKYIELHQPQNNPRYKNDFLENVPTTNESKAAGNPLPGGFNNNMLLKDKTPYSPMSIEKLKTYPQLTAKTDLGKCAQMSYMTTAGRNSQYRYTFVYDPLKELCYFLLVPMQRMMGERYCSNNNVPPGLTWYCFEPKKSATENLYLVYGSSYVGEDPDAWEKNCPNKAVARAVFGVWENGRCVEHRNLADAQIEKVNSKEECWELAFKNPRVASDHPVSESENVGTFGYYFPLPAENQPKSGGEGVNYASFYGGDQMECVLSSVVPTCLVPTSIGTAYTALGGLEEELMPSCGTSFPQSRSECNPMTCKATLTLCQNGNIVTSEVDCLPADGSKCGAGRAAPVPSPQKEESNSSPLVLLSIAGGVLLLVLAGTGAFFYFRRKSTSPPAPGEGRKEFVQDQAAPQRGRQRQSDLVQQAEPSFWEEAADADPDAADDNTHVLVDQDF